MKLLITGAKGLVGSAILNNNQKYEIIPIDSSYDLTKEQVVESIFNRIKPDYVIHTAAKVGGVGGNKLLPATYYYENILMNSYIIHYSYKFNVKKLFVFSSVCAFPDNLKVLKENYLHFGEPSKFNTEYAYAKRMVDVQIQAYKKQFNVENYCSIIPVNIFGQNDNYNIESGHIIPSLIHKIYKAKIENADLQVWGDGTPQREFIYSVDLAKILLNLLEIQIPDKIIISNSIEYSIKQIVEILCEVSNFNNNILWDISKPNGQLKRPSDTTILKNLIKYDFTDIKTSLKQSYEWFENNYTVSRK
jgi:GDP-L-fucose synthase